MERIDIRYALTEVTRDKRFVESLQWRSEEIFYAQENLAACVLVTAVENVSIQLVFWSLGPLSKTCLLQKRLPLSNGHFPRPRTLKKTFLQRSDEYLKDRCNEHRRHILNPTGNYTHTAVSEHFLTSHYSDNHMLSIPIEKLKNGRDSFRKAREAHLIHKAKSLRASINVMNCNYI